MLASLSELTDSQSAVERKVRGAYTKKPSAPTAIASARAAGSTKWEFVGSLVSWRVCVTVFSFSSSAKSVSALRHPRATGGNATGAYASLQN